MAEELTIMCLNVQGLQGRLKNSFSDSFVSYLKKFDIAILTETKRGIRGIPSVLQDTFGGFTLPSRKLNSSTQGASSGGIMILYKKGRFDCQQITDIRSMIGVLITIDCFRIALLGVYRVNEDSKYYNSNFFEDLSFNIQLIKFNYPDASMLVMGDFNVHTGSRNVRMDNKTLADSFRWVRRRVTTCRSTCDRMPVDEAGNNLISSCEKLKLVILNGTTDGDREGKCTWHSRSQNGVESVLDYALVSHNFEMELKDFCVDTEIFDGVECAPDHRPIIVSLNVQLNLEHENITLKETLQRLILENEHLKKELEEVQTESVRLKGAGQSLLHAMTLHKVSLKANQALDLHRFTTLTPKCWLSTKSQEQLCATKIVPEKNTYLI